MQIKIEKTDQEWSNLLTEVLILKSCTTNMYLQYICDLIQRTVHPLVKGYQEKRAELVKKHGEKTEEDSYVVKEFDEKGETLESHKAFMEEFKPIRDHKTSLTVECIEIDLFKKENPQLMQPAFAQFGASNGVYAFHQIFTITDRAAIEQSNR